MTRRLHPQYATGFQTSQHCSKFDCRPLRKPPVSFYLFSPFCARFFIGSAPARCSLTRTCPSQSQRCPVPPRRAYLIFQALGAPVFGGKSPWLAPAALSLPTQTPAYVPRSLDTSCCVCPCFDCGNLRRLCGRPHRPCGFQAVEALMAACLDSFRGLPKITDSFCFFVQLLLLLKYY